MTLFEWVVTSGMVALLFLAWYSVRTLSQLLLQIVSEVARMRTAIDITSRSYLGIESVWEAHHREMGQFGSYVAQYTAKDLPSLSGRRMGDLFAEMALELKRIRRRIRKAVGPEENKSE